MLKLLSTIIGQPVISQRDGIKLTTVTGVVGDASSGKIVAYRVASTPGFIVTTDILAYLDEGLVISDADSMQPEDELIRIKRLGDSRTAFLGTKVVTEQGKRLGTVNDILIETEGGFMTRLHVRPGFPNRLFSSERIIPRERVIKMDSCQAVVRYDEKAPVSAEPEIVQ
jgi:sporulation protein YlmC with PRC-barrel domain